MCKAYPHAKGLPGPDRSKRLFSFFPGVVLPRGLPGPCPGVLGGALGVRASCHPLANRAQEAGAGRALGSPSTAPNHN